jgi:hypothetical protein
MKGFKIRNPKSAIRNLLTVVALVSGRPGKASDARRCNRATLPGKEANKVCD